MIYWFSTVININAFIRKNLSAQQDAGVHLGAVTAEKQLRSG